MDYRFDFFFRRSMNLLHLSRLPQDWVAVVEGSTSAPFNLRNALRDATKLLAELEGTTLKADPAQVELAPSHAGLAALAHPKVVVQTKAEMNFSPFGKGGA